MSRIQAHTKLTRDTSCPRCGWTYEFERSCGAWVCRNCGAHRHLARCYCGWAADGGDGRRQLIEMGETIDPED